MHPVLKQALLGRSQTHYSRAEDFVFPSHRSKGLKPLDLAAVLKRKIKPAFAKVGVTQVGWHTFRHTVGTMLAEMGEHQLTIRDYPAAQQPACDQQIFAGHGGKQAAGSGQISGRDFANRFVLGDEIETGPIAGKNAYWTLSDPD